MFSITRFFDCKVTSIQNFPSAGLPEGFDSVATKVPDVVSFMFSTGATSIKVYFLGRRQISLVGRNLLNNMYQVLVLYPQNNGGIC